MTIIELVQKYNDPLSGLFKNNAPSKGINAATLRDYVDDTASVMSELEANLAYSLRTEWITLGLFPTSLIGGGTAVLVDSQPDYFGLLQLLTNAAGGGVHVTTSKVLLDKSLLLKTRIKIPTLSTGPQSFYYRFGLLADPTIRNQVDGAYFEYSHDVNGGQWLVNVYKAGVLTQTLTTIPVVIDTAYILQINYIPTVGLVFLINGSAVAFIAQVNLPIVAMQYANGLRKYNGAANASVFIDSDLIINNLAL